MKRVKWLELYLSRAEFFVSGAASRAGPAIEWCLTSWKQHVSVLPIRNQGSTKLVITSKTLRLLL